LEFNRLALSAERRRLYMGSAVEEDPELPRSVL
jgi:hypothetical protein